MSEKEITSEILKQAITASLHFGHIPKKWNPKIAPYLNGVKGGYHLFNLVKTLKLLKIAGDFVRTKSASGNKFLFVGTSPAASLVVKEQALFCKSFYINYRWLGGLITNWNTIQKKLIRLKELESQKATQLWDNLSKQKQLANKKELLKLLCLFEGIKDMQVLPDVIIFTNQIKEYHAIKECLLLGIPAISIVDSNCDPELTPFPIVANDDSSASIKFITHYLATQILNGKKIKY
jgi:small subunit ribosomal protein S2